MKIGRKVWTNKIEREQYAAVLLSSAVWFVPLRTLLIKIGNMCQYELGGILSKASMVLFFTLFVVPVLLQLRYTKDFMIWVVFVAVSWIVSLIFHLEYIDFWVGEALDIFVRALPFYLFIQNIDDWTNAKAAMYKAGMITVVIMMAYTIIGQRMDTLFTGEHRYNQYNGVIMAGAATLCLIAFLDQKKKRYLLMTTASMVMLVIFGTRMPIACMLLAFGFYFLAGKVKRNSGRLPLRLIWKKIRFGLFIAAVITGIGIAVARLQSVHMDKIAVGQRILYQISNGEFFQSKGRLEIAKAAWKAIKERPVLGYGIIADRMPIAECISGDLSKFAGTYAHNLFLELWLQYGVVLGSILILIVLYAAWRLIFSDNYSRDKQMIAIYAVSMTFGILLFSGPNYSQKEFWMVLGMGAMYRNKING